NEFVSVEGRLLSGTYFLHLDDFAAACKKPDELRLPDGVDRNDVKAMMPYAYVLVDEIMPTSPHEDINLVIIDGMAVKNHRGEMSTWTNKDESYQRWVMYLARSQALNKDSRAAAGKKERGIYFTTCIQMGGTWAYGDRVAFTGSLKSFNNQKSLQQFLREQP